MDERVIEKLSELTDEERQIIRSGRIEKSDYSTGEKFIVNWKKLMSDGRDMALRPHTRFTDFPEHSHNFIEFMYVYSGSITHLIGGERIALERGDILILNRHIRHAVLRADRDDLGINFILSENFTHRLHSNILGNRVMCDFLENNFKETGEGQYLLFRAGDIFPVRNLMDNLIYAAADRREGDEGLISGLVEVLFSYLALYRGALAGDGRADTPRTKLMQAVRNYVKRRPEGMSLKSLAEDMGYTQAYLSRRIAQLFGKSFKELVLEDMGMSSSDFVFDWQLTAQEEDLTLADFDGWSRVDADMVVNGVLHTPISNYRNYIQYGRPGYEVEADFAPVSMQGRVYARYFAEQDVSIYFYIMARSAEVLEACDREFIAQSEITLSDK